MSHTPTDDPSKESRILRAMRQVLTHVIKDTTTKPGLKHPLSNETIEDIRQCLMLITARERELAESEGKPMAQRPRYTDEPAASVVVPIKNIGRSTKKDSSKD
jgi:hypothetical protein